MDAKVELERRLREMLEPEELTIVDESERHRGHSGHIPGVPTHFRVRIRAARLAGLSRIERQRAVYAAVGDLMGAPVHALVIDAEAPAGVASASG